MNAPALIARYFARLQNRLRGFVDRNMHQNRVQGGAKHLHHSSIASVALKTSLPPINFNTQLIEMVGATFSS